MKASIIPALVLALIVGALASSTSPAGAGGKWDHHSGDMDFLVGYENGRKAAEVSGKPMMLFFTTTWCGWCKRLAADSFRNPDVIRKLVRFVPVIVDGDNRADAPIAREHGVRGFPHIIFATLDGKTHGSVRGWVPSATFSEHVDRALKSVGKIEVRQDYIRQLKRKVKDDYTHGKTREAMLGILELESSGIDPEQYQKALDLKARMEKLANKKLAEAKELLSSNPSKGKKILEAITRKFIGLAAATEARKLLG